MAARNTSEGDQNTLQRTAGQDQATQTQQSGQDEHPRLARNVPSDQTVPEQVYADYAQNYARMTLPSTAKSPTSWSTRRLLASRAPTSSWTSYGPTFRSSRRC